MSKYCIYHKIFQQMNGVFSLARCFVQFWCSPWFLANRASFLWSRHPILFLYQAINKTNTIMVFLFLTSQKQKHNKDNDSLIWGDLNYRFNTYQYYFLPLKLIKILGLNSNSSSLKGKHRNWTTPQKNNQNLPKIGRF